MRTFTLVAIALLLIGPMFVQAQQGKEMELTKDALEANRKLLVSNNMQLTEEQHEAFWPLYESFQTELHKINERTAKLIENYAANYYSLTDEKAKSLLAEALDIDEDHVKLKKRYVEKFEAKLPSKTVARYFQLENKFEAIIEFELARLIPLVQ